MIAVLCFGETISDKEKNRFSKRNLPIRIFPSEKLQMCNNAYENCLTYSNCIAKL